MQAKKINTLNAVLYFFLAIFSTTPVQAADSYTKMQTIFRTPASVQTSCYWYWISGNVSKQGVINDLQSMKKAGINRAFIGFQGIPEINHGPVYIQTNEWYDILHTALKTATKLNIEIGIFNGTGWSQAGGPWISPEQSMRYLGIQRQTVEESGYQTIHFIRPEAFLHNVKVLAYRTHPGHTSIRKGIDQITPKGISDAVQMFDGKLNTTATCDSQKISITIRPLKKTFTLRSLRILSTTPIHGDFSVQVVHDGQPKEICHFEADRTNMMPEVGYDILAPVAISVPATNGLEFRIEAKINTGCKIGELEFSENPIIDHYADKILSKMHQTPQPTWNDYKWVNPTDISMDEAIPENKIVDITNFCHGDSVQWDVPEGQWEIVRTYMAPTRICNGPAFDGDGRGPEVDRWSLPSLSHHYNSFIGKILKRVPKHDRKTWKLIVCDSYEKGTQNFGDDFISYFKSHFGYDPTPYLLTFAGTVVGNTDKSERFLWDLRRMIADRLAYDHIGGLKSLAHKDGLRLWLEPYGHWGFPGEFLQYGGQSDEVAGEFWSEGTLGDIENRAASSVAHIYGKAKVSSESFTCGGPEFVRSPRNMKQRGDKFFTEGINNSLLHLYVSQPNDSTIPGVNCPFGNEFNRKNTWYSQLDLFTTYLKRCNYLLQQGNYVADVAYYIGEDAPVMTGITQPPLSKGFQYDFINAEVIRNYLSVNDNHILELPHGTQYKLLVLPPTKSMRPEVLRKIKQLLMDGAIITGSKPEKSPSLQNYTDADIEVKAITRELWGDKTCKQTIRRVGKGILFTGYSIDEIFNMIDNKPDFYISDIGSDVQYAHTTMRGRDIYFITNQTEKKIDFTAHFRVKGKVPELWNPVDGSIRPLKSFVNTGSATSIPMRLFPNQSVFVVFAKKIRDEVQTIDSTLNFPDAEELLKIKNPWGLTLQSLVQDGKTLKSFELKDLSTDNDEYIRYFSGTAVYTNTFYLNHSSLNGKTIILDLGEVREMAKVKLNGRYAGGVWTAPYKLDITEFLKSGVNSIEISVVTNWANRLVGDSKLPNNKRKTSYTFRTLQPDTPLQKTGLIGPVRILVQ